MKSNVKTGKKNGSQIALLRLIVATAQKASRYNPNRSEIKWADDVVEQFAAIGVRAWWTGGQLAVQTPVGNVWGETIVIWIGRGGYWNEMPEGTLAPETIPHIRRAFNRSVETSRYLRTEEQEAEFLRAREERSNNANTILEAIVNNENYQYLAKNRHRPGKLFVVFRSEFTTWSEGDYDGSTDTISGYMGRDEFGSLVDHLPAGLDLYDRVLAMSSEKDVAILAAYHHLKGITTIAAAVGPALPEEERGVRFSFSIEKVGMQS